MNASTRLPIILIAAFAALTIPATSCGQELAEIPFSMPTPEGWRTETIPFPLEFAPELEYEGLEELRFAPGMFDAAAATTSAVIELSGRSTVRGSQPPPFPDLTRGAWPSTTTLQVMELEGRG